VAVVQGKTKEKNGYSYYWIYVSEVKEVAIKCYELPKGKNYSGNGANDEINSHNSPHSDCLNKELFCVIFAYFL
jgi:hypothetical protein